MTFAAPGGRGEGTVAYELRGQFLEACDCHVMCPCWFEEDPDEDSCTGFMAWYVEKGVVDGVDVSGLTAISVSHHEGHRGRSKMRVAFFVDEWATDEQVAVLYKAFTGALGGPLGDLARLDEDVTSVRRAPIKLTSDSAGTELTVGNEVTTTVKPLVGATGRIISVADSALAKVLGTPADVCKSSRFKLDMSGEGFDLDLSGRSANRGRFVYVRKASYA